jgi:hypothetical protein
MFLRRLARSTKLAAALLAALSLTLIQPLGACPCSGAIASVAAQPMKCCCSHKCAELARNCCCAKKGGPARERSDCTCTRSAPKQLAPAPGSPVVVKLQTSHFVIAILPRAVDLQDAGRLSYFDLADVGGPSGPRLHAQFSVWQI